MQNRTFGPLFASLALTFGLVWAVGCDDEPSSSKVSPEAAATVQAAPSTSAAAATASASAVVASAPDSSAAPAPSASGAKVAADDEDDLDDLDDDDDDGPGKKPAGAAKKGATDKKGDAATPPPKKGDAATKAGSSTKAGDGAKATASDSGTSSGAGNGTAKSTDGTAKSGEPTTPKPEQFAAPDAATPGTAEAIAEKVDAIYKPVGLFRARFDQHYTAKIAGTTKKSSGVVYIKRPAKISFSYRDPNKNRVVSDGVTLKIYEHENQQMFLKPVAQTEYPGALAFIMGKGLRHSFTFAFHTGSKWEGGPVLVGTPRTPNAGYEKVLFYIDEEMLKKGDPQCVRRVLVIDAQGNKNRFDFIHVEQPESIGDAEFTFEPPPGTNIIK